MNTLDESARSVTLKFSEEDFEKLRACAKYRSIGLDEHKDRLSGITRHLEPTLSYRETPEPLGGERKSG